MQHPNKGNTNNMTTTTVKIVGNRDTGSLHVSADQLPERFRTHGMVPAQGDLQILVEGESKARNVTYIMGSKGKGFFLCAKGQGPFPTDGSAEIISTDAE